MLTESILCSNTFVILETSFDLTSYPLPSFVGVSSISLIDGCRGLQIPKTTCSNTTDRPEHMTTSTTNIADLINLLDKETLNALSERLSYVASWHETPINREQLLFEFIDEGLTACEEEINGAPKVELNPEAAKAFQEAITQALQTAE